MMKCTSCKDNVNFPECRVNYLWDGWMDGIDQFDSLIFDLTFPSIFDQCDQQLYNVESLVLPIYFTLILHFALILTNFCQHVVCGKEKQIFRYNIFEF